MSARLPMSTVPRTETTDEPQGFMKALVDASDERHLGFTMIGAEAGEVMAEFTVLPVGTSQPSSMPPRLHRQMV